jgi:SAF domain
MIRAKRVSKSKPSNGGEMTDRFDAIIASSGMNRKPKPNVIGAGVAIVVVGGLLGGLAFGSGRDTHLVIAAAHPLEAGSVIVAADLRSVEVPGAPTFLSMSAGQASSLIGRVAAVPIEEGTLVTGGQFRNRQSAPEGTVLVGMVLDPGALPTPDLRYGDRVNVLVISSPNDVIDQPATVITEATVWKVWGGNEGSGRRAVTLAVPTEIAVSVGDAASRNLIRLLVIPNDGTIFTDLKPPEVITPNAPSAEASTTEDGKPNSTADGVTPASVAPETAATRGQTEPAPVAPAPGVKAEQP